MTVRDGAPQAPVSATPVLAAFPSALARAGLGAVAAGGESATVSFPAPGAGIPEYVPFSTAPVTVSRSLWDQAEGAARGAVSDAGAAVQGAVSDAGAAVQERAQDAVADAGAAVRERAGAAVDAVTGAAGSGAGAADKAFEELYDRLKRELLIEQEQLGQLFHEP